VQVIDIGVNGIAPAPEGTYSSTIISRANGQHPSRLLDRFHILEGTILQVTEAHFFRPAETKSKGGVQVLEPS
jgi:hypothetical protein